MHLLKNLNFSAIPVKAEGNLVGYINNIDIPDATFTADMIPLPDGSATRVNATLRNVPRPVGKDIVNIQLYIPYFFHYETEFFPFQNNPKNLDPSVKMDLDIWDCPNWETCIISKLLRTDLVIFSHSREGKPLSYSQINTEHGMFQ